MIREKSARPRPAIVMASAFGSASVFLGDVSSCPDVRDLVACSVNFPGYHQPGRPELLLDDAVGCTDAVKGGQDNDVLSP